MYSRYKTYSKSDTKKKKMELSWILNTGCKLRVRSTTRFVLIYLMTLTSFILLLQTIYLHGQSAVLPPESYSVAGRRMAMFGRMVKEGVFSNKDITLPLKPKYMPYEHFGKETGIARFNLKGENSTVRIFDEDIEMKGTQKYYLYRHPSKVSSKFNGNITIHKMNPGAFSTSSPKNIYIMSSFARNMVQLVKGKSRFKKPDPFSEMRLISQVGWLNYSLVNSTLDCCVLLANDSIVSFTNTKRLVWTQVNKQPLMATKFFCSIPRELYGMKIKGSTISLPEEQCMNKKFLAVEVLKEQPVHSLAVCAKIAYATLNAQRLIEWLEIQKFMEVDKVLIYFYNLNEEAMRVLLDYQRDGFVELQPFDYPDADDNQRYVGEKEAQPFIDEQVVLYDAMERLRGYTYVAVVDVDEILFARTSPGHSMKRFMYQLLRRNPTAAGFSFRTELFITDWDNKEDMGPEMNKFWHARHLNRTRPLEDRVKSVLVMDRVILGSVWTHNYTAKAPYSKFKVSASMGTLKHYRPCRANWHCFIRRGYKDETVARIMENVKDEISAKFASVLDKKTNKEINDRARSRHVEKKKG